MKYLVYVNEYRGYEVEAEDEEAAEDAVFDFRAGEENTGVKEVGGDIERVYVEEDN